MYARKWKMLLFFINFLKAGKRREKKITKPPKKMAKRKHRLVHSHASKACGAQRSLGQTMRFSKRHIVPGRPACLPAVGPRALKRVRRQAALLSPENWWLTSSVKEALMRRGGGGRKNRSLGTCFLFSLSPPSPAAAPPTWSRAFRSIPSPASLPFRPPGLIGEHIYVFTRMSPNNETTNSSQCRESNPSQSNPSDPRLSPQD